MKNTLFMFIVTFLTMSYKSQAQTLVDSCELQMFEVIEYKSDTLKTFNRNVLSIEKGSVTAVDENGEFFTLKKKKKKSSDSAINVTLSSNYPPEGLIANDSLPDDTCNIKTYEVIEYNLDTFETVSRHNLFYDKINKEFIDENGDYWILKKKENFSWNYKKTLIGCSIAFIGGISSGYHETTLNHYPKFKAVHPYANNKYFNPAESWVNKYKNGDPMQGEAFFLSTTALVPFTDFYHLTNTIDRLGLLGSTVYVTIGEKRKWWEYGIDIVATYLFRLVGFHLIYSGIYCR